MSSSHVSRARSAPEAAPFRWSEGDLEPVVCPLCGPGPGARLRFHFAPFRVAACNHCGLNFLSPRLNERAMLRLYQDQNYFRSAVPGQGYDEYLDVRENWLKSFARRLRQIQKYRPVGRVLDVGCGPGFFMEAAAHMGYDVWGVDPSDYIVRVARERFGARVQHGTIHTADFEPQSFDVVVAFDTFEHVYDPLKFLDQARTLLKPRGVLAITTPDPTSVLARVFRRRWVSFKIPEHIFYWSREPMKRALADRFSILEMTSAGQYATLSFLARRLFGLGASVSGPVKLLLDALTRFSVYTNNGSLTVIAMKLPEPP
jgi:SAM-dependent methyltransferase